MTKPHPINHAKPIDAVAALPAAPSWREIEDDDDRRSKPKSELGLAAQIMNAMEQGIIVWSPSGVCELHNTRIFDILEIEPDALSIGTLREEFLSAGVQRGDFSAEQFADTNRRLELHVPFQFDRTMPSGRVVATYARPTREGGYVVTYTDVTEARTNAAHLVEAKQTAETAEAQARQVLQDERARRAEARAMSDLDEWLQSCKSLDELFMIVQKFMNALLPDTCGELYLYSNSRDVLDGACEWGQPVGQINDHIIAEDCWALRRGRSYQHNPTTICFPCDHLDIKDGETPSDYICIPVIAHGDTVGLLHVHFDPKVPHADVKTMGRFASRCAEHISMAIANVKLRDELHDQSIRDPLTGLYNRRYFMDAMRRETAGTDRGGAGYGLISFDADKFKMFNDGHGHEAGDAVLRALAEKMLSTLPEQAICARVGGEEFTVLLPRSDIDETMRQADILRRAVESMEVRTNYDVLPKVTISSGVAEYTGNGTPPSVLIKRADEALYAAKAAGRNCVKQAAPDVSQSAPKGAPEGP